MALAVLKDLPAHTPVRDPAWFEVLCGGFQGTAATAAAFTLTLDSQPSDGDTMSMLLGTEVMTLTFVTGPIDDSGTQVLIGPSTAQTAVNLLSAMQENYAVGQLFTLTALGTTITGVAIQAGVIELAFNDTTPTHLTFTQTVAGAGGDYTANYSANAQIWIEEEWNSGIFIPVPAVSGAPDPNLRTKWDLSDSLRPSLGYEWPAYDQTTMMLQRKMQRHYRVHRWEAFGDTPLPQRMDVSAVKRAWYMGSRNLEHNTFQDVYTLLALSGVLNPFLTYRGRAGKHEVSSYQKHYLGYLRRTNKVADDQLQVLATVYYTDNTTATTAIYTDTNTSNWERYDVALFPTGFEVNDLETLEPTKIPWKYGVQVRTADNVPLSEVHTFHLMDRDANEVHVEYVNSLGVVESVRCIGRWEVGMESNNEVVSRLLTVTNGVLPDRELSNRIALPRGAERTLELSTGFMDQGELNAVADLLTSPELRLIMPDQRTRQPITLAKAQNVMRVQGTEDEHLYALNMQVLLGDKEMAWSDRPSMPTVITGILEPWGD